MKRVILGFSLFVCGISTLSAQEIETNNAVATTLKKHNLTQSQAEFLFGTQNLNELNVEILSMQELKETQGKFWGKWLLKWVKTPLIPPVQVCNACFLREW